MVTKKDTFLAMVKFLVTADPLVINGDNVVELLSVSEQFYCETLKLACQRFIQDEIEVETVSSLFEVADRYFHILAIIYNSYRAVPLFHACLWYILANYDEVSKTEGNKSQSLFLIS
jgi:hypothetical protein